MGASAGSSAVVAGAPAATSSLSLDNSEDGKAMSTAGLLESPILTRWSAAGIAACAELSNLRREQAGELFAMSDKYQVAGLSEASAQLLSAFLTVENMCASVAMFMTTA